MIGPKSFFLNEPEKNQSNAITQLINAIMSRSILRKINQNKKQSGMIPIFKCACYKDIFINQVISF